MDNYSSANRMRPSASLNPSLAQNLHYSQYNSATNTQSWHNNQQIPSGLHNHDRLHNPYPHPLHVINRTPMTDGEDDYMHQSSVARRPNRFDKTNSESTPTDFSPAVSRPRKKKSFVGGFVKGIRRLPKTVFGYGSSASSGKNRLEYFETTDAEDTATVVTGMSNGNSLPLYTSNPVTPVTGPGPSRSTPYRPTPVSPIPESPPPAVVRLSDVPQHDSNHSVLPGNFDPEPGGSHLFAPQGHRLIENLQSEGSYSNPVERTTVMLYGNDPDSQSYNRNSRGPLPTPPVVPQQVSSPGLSYVSEPLAPLAPLRPASFHSSHVSAQPQPRAPAEIPRISSSSAISQRTSQVLPPQRVPPPSLIPGLLHSSSHSPSQQPIADSHHQPQPEPETQNAPQTAPRSAEPPPIEPIQSPVDAHPTLAPDYREMTLGSSPSSPDILDSRHRQSHYDPSFSSELSPVERFFKTLYRMPWVSHERVTVDYKPGVGLGHMKKKKTKPLSSWYRSMLAGSRRSSATLDLLSSSNRTGTDRTSLGRAVAAALAAPLSPSKHSGRSSDNKRKPHHHHYHHHQQHHRSPHHHHKHHEKSGHPKKRHTSSSVETTDTDADEKYAGPYLSPIPYPMQYQPYPYPAYPAFPVAAPAAAMQSAQKQAGDNPTSSSGSSAMMYAPAGYASYQPMVAPAPVYTNSSVQQTTTTASNTGAATGQQGAQSSQQSRQPAPAPSGMVYTPAIPGAFT
ncbi:hypothetical protein CPB84DRAFT_1777364 [Gymnopilus junonius]|uniref:Uncharacterized protein n=1 Tax=Gymnopilus junonius TaxID=109634 RepID=A0A9P5NQM4_GYMJU|nr:hypothetical protein CPB84DRAFT_1777364 [Gymnopilus junonius]